ncbi:MAG: hypothetical protein WAN11_05905 [Syntrophobacteraceae bacterium]
MIQARSSNPFPGLHATLLWLLFGAAFAFPGGGTLPRLFYAAAFSTFLRAASAAFTDATGVVWGPASAGFTRLFLLVGATCTRLSPTS